MSQEDLDLAASLIKQKKYTQARAILNTISDDPKAREWLIRLDQLAPVQNIQSAPQTAPQVVYIKEDKKKGGCLKKIAGMGILGIGMIVCLIVVVCGGLFVIISAINEGEKAATKGAIANNGGFGTEDKPIASDKWAKFKDGEIRATQINPDALDQVMEMNFLNDDPAAGSRYVLIYFEVKCNKDSCNQYELDFRLEDETGQLWDEADFVVTDPPLDDAVKGATMGGWQVFELSRAHSLKVIRLKWGTETLFIMPPEPVPALESLPPAVTPSAT